MDERLEERVRTELEGLRGAIEVLVLFGSRASGRGHDRSDLDVAVLPAPGLGEEDRRRLPTRVATALADVVPYARVDVVSLEGAPELLRQRIMEGGRVLWGASSPAWKSLRVRTMREHGDREWVRRRLREAQHARLTEGRPSGRSGRALRSLERVGDLPRGSRPVR